MLGQKVKQGLGLAVLGLWVLSLGGCLAAAVAYGAHKISDSKSEAADKEAESRLVDSYTRYKVETEKTNLEREKAGMKPLPVQNFAEWKVAVKPGPPPKEEKKPEAAQAETSKE